MEGWFDYPGTFESGEQMRQVREEIRRFPADIKEKPD